MEPVSFAKGQLISKGLFVFSILPKNERKNSAPVVFKFVFWKNWRHQKDISIIFKGSFCGYCKKSEDRDLMSCSRCRLAKYCSTDCQKNDFSNHKNDCQWVGHFQDMMPKIEKLYSNWDGGENIFETQGEYSAWKAKFVSSQSYISQVL